MKSLGNLSSLSILIVSARDSNSWPRYVTFSSKSLCLAEKVCLDNLNEADAATAGTLGVATVVCGLGVVVFEACTCLFQTLARSAHPQETTTGAIVLVVRYVTENV